MMENLNEARNWLMLSGTRVYNNKTVDELTDKECQEAKDYIQGITGIYTTFIRR